MPTYKRDNARGQAGEVGEANSYQRCDSTATDLFPEISTSGEAQRQRIIAMLRTGQKHTLDFRRAGIMQSQTRVHELRALGYDIPTVGRVTVIDDQGFPHHGVALYELIAEPSGGAQ